MLDFAGRMRKGLLLGALLVLARVLAGAAERDIPVSPEAAEAFNAARRLQQTGDAASAEREFVRALRHTPDFPHAQTALADLRMDAGRAGEAEALYTQVLKRHPAWLAAASSLGFLYLETGRLDQAVGQLSHAAALNPAGSTLLNLGAAQKQAGDLPGAIATYRRARRAEPAEPRGAYNLGNALYANGDLAGAIAQYREAHKLNPAHTDTLNNMANALRDAGDGTGARRALERAAAVDPANVAALCNLGGMYLESGDLDHSLQALDAALRLAPSLPEVVCSRANTLHKLNQTSAAIAEYQRVVAEMPDVLAYRRGSKHTHTHTR